MIFYDQLEKRIENNPNSKDNEILDNVGKSAVIGGFKLFFDQLITIMRKYIEFEDGRYECATYKCFFRTAGEKGLIDDFYKWMEFYRARDSVSEVPYSDEAVNNICLITKEFDIYAKKIISVLEEKIPEM
ncbi:MAG: nucleotidyltransferase substrate binding protein [Methanobrevibacter sp.]|nr:nucleotidyltransferase substrate binding protein [Methanobrevibacter sp.]